MKFMLILSVIATFSASVAGQGDNNQLPPLSMDEAVWIAVNRHPVAVNADLAEKKDYLMRQQSVEFAPLHVKYWQRNAPSGNDRIWSVTQDFGSIPEHIRRAQHSGAVTSTREAERVLTFYELEWQVKSAYMEAVYYRRRYQIMLEHANYFEALISLAEIYLFADTIPELAKVSAGTRYAAYQSRMYIAEEELKRAETRLCQLLYIPDGKIELSQTELYLYSIHYDKISENRFVPDVSHNALNEAQLTEAKSAVKLEKSRLYPAVHAGYIYQHIEGMNNYQGWMVGMSLPLWTQPQRARVKQAEIDANIKLNETEYRRFAGQQHVETLKSLLNGYFVQISFSNENSLLEAKLTLEEVEKDFSTGRITNYTEAFTKVSNAVFAKLNHLEYFNLYNQTALELEYYTQ